MLSTLLHYNTHLYVSYTHRSKCNQRIESKVEDGRSVTKKQAYYDVRDEHGIVDNTPAQLSAAARGGEGADVPGCDVRWVGQRDRKAPKTQHPDVDLVPEQTNKQKIIAKGRACW
jgi:hypothetical protein